MTTPSYPFYTKIVNRKGFREHTIDSVFAYISPRHKVRIDLFLGHESMSVDQGYDFSPVEPPQWEPSGKYEWYEEISTKKEFTLGLKRFHERTKEALLGQDYRHDQEVLSHTVKKAYSL